MATRLIADCPDYKNTPVSAGVFFCVWRITLTIASKKLNDTLYRNGVSEKRMGNRLLMQVTLGLLPGRASLLPTSLLFNNLLEGRDVHDRYPAEPAFGDLHR